MKRLLFLLVAIASLTVSILLHSPSVSAASHQNHCVCGGSAVGIGDHTQCQSTSWTALSQVMPLDRVDFGKLPSGYYYLDGSVTVTGQSSLGSKSNNLSILADHTVEITLCLNGFDIACTTSRPFGSLYAGSSLRICDCSGQQTEDGWHWQGTVTGGFDIRGGIVYTFAGSRLSIYGGNYIGTANTGGGAFVVACDYSGDVNKDGSYTEEDKLLSDPSTMSLYNGTITGCHVSNSGGSILLYHNAVFNMYGGTIQNGSADKQGGNIISTPTGHLNILGGTITGGTAQMGGNIYINGEMTLSGATVCNGHATVCNGNIFTRSAIDLTSNLLYGGSPEAVRIITVADGIPYSSEDYTLAVALKKLTAGSYLQLSGDLQEDAVISGTVYLDMNGYDLSGVTITGTLYGFDSATNTYADGQAGLLNCTVNGGQIIPHHKTEKALTGQICRYLCVEEDNGYSFHRFYLGITAISLRPNNGGMGYKAVFAGDSAIRGALNDTQAYGYTLWVDNQPPVKRGYDAHQFGGNQTLTLSLNSIFSQANSTYSNAKNAEAPVHVVAYIHLKSGEILSSSEIAYCLKDIFHMADAQFGNYNQTQQHALLQMSAQYSNAMVTWDIPNTHHATGGIWTPVDQKGFIALLTKQDNYNIREGNYVLTENINLGSRTLNVENHAEITICLNGYTINSSGRTVNIHGKLNLCDCHPVQQEGSIVSSSSVFAPVFYVYHDAIFNLYGGNLRATRKTEHTGIGAVSHDGDNVTDPAGILNMYGGCIHGNQVIGNGGAISLWNGASFNMYGGLISGGVAGNGGAVNASSYCSFNLYGGTVEGNSAIEQGGGVFLQNETATLNIHGGTIRNNTATLGGGVFNYKGSLNFYGGEVTRNTGGGLYFLGGDVTLSGKVYIGENEDSDLDITLGGSINADGLETGSVIGLRTDARCCLSRNPAVKDCFVVENSRGYRLQTYNGKLMLWPEQITSISPAVGFQVGFASVCIDPIDPVGNPLSGFGNSAQRLSTEILDSLYATATAITDESGNTVLLMTCDLLKLPETATISMRKDISRVIDIPYENIYISCSHTHSAPETAGASQSVNKYVVYVRDLLTGVALDAMADRASATMQCASTEIPRMNFVRHYYYLENGSKQYVGDAFGLMPADRSDTNLFHAAQGDHSMQLIRFNRSNAKSIVLCNWAAHPTMTGSRDSTQISSDYVYYLRKTVEDTENCHFAFIQGAAGNMNPISYIDGESLFAKDEYQQYGKKLAQYVSTGLENMTDLSLGYIETDQYVFSAPINHTEDHRVDDAKKLVDIYDSWQAQTGAAGNAALEFCMGYGFSSIHHANSVISKASKSATSPLEVNVFCIGTSLGFYTVPGELWAETALQTKATSPFAMTFTVGYTNVDGSYFPDGIAADGTYENYETHLSAFLFPDTINILKAYWNSALTSLGASGQ